MSWFYILVGCGCMASATGFVEERTHKTWRSPSRRRGAEGSQLATVPVPLVMLIDLGGW